MVENFLTLDQVYYEVRYEMAKRPCASREGLWKNGHVDPPIRSFGTWWKFMVNFKPQSLYPLGKRPGTR
jgi:hypothetical protein